MDLGQSLRKLLEQRRLNSDLIDSVLESGYFLRNWSDLRGGTYQTVSDQMYGTKQFSSSFPIDNFVEYIQGIYSFPELPPFKVVTVRNFAELEAFLETPHLKFYREEGSLTFRGQPRQYHFKRKIPNPVRSDNAGRELSIMSGAYRQTEQQYNFKRPITEASSIRPFLQNIEGCDEIAGSDRYDPIRVEQHYASQTRGLDLTFDLRVALFFAANRFTIDSDGYGNFKEVVEEGNSVIYCFRFRDPPVKRSSFLIRDFDFFKVNRPERIIRQNCGLPLFSDSERNIAITDIDCIIRLDANFAIDSALSQKYLFPSAQEDAFYKRLLELKDNHPEYFSDIVEYKWARQR